MFISLLKKMKAGILLFTMLFVLLFILFILPAGTLLAQVMQSSTYKISSDSVNVGGLNSSGSTNYKMGDTLGEVGTGDSSSSNYTLHAGFWQMQESYISISSPADLALTEIGGMNGDVHGLSTEGILSWQVITDNTAGYSVSIQTATTPALKSSLDSFADYTPGGANPDYTFVPPTTTSAFGFSPEGVDTNARFLDNGSACNTGSSETVDKCWDGLSLSPKIIATRTSSNQPAGSAVNVRFRAESGTSHIQISGAYSASITVTAVTL